MDAKKQAIHNDTINLIATLDKAHTDAATVEEQHELYKFESQLKNLLDEFMGWGHNGSPVLEDTRQTYIKKCILNTLWLVYPETLTSKDLIARMTDYYDNITDTEKTKDIILSVLTSLLKSRKIKVSIVQDKEIGYLTNTYKYT